MRDFTDQMNNTIRLETSPSRIVSLVPSQTELLYALGLEDEVIGITKFCIHPNEWFVSKKRVGGTKNVDVDKVSIKATTTEKLSFVGREEGVSAYATVLINKI